MKIRNFRAAGFTLVEIMIVVAIIGLLAAIAIPNFVRARTTSQENVCVNNLRQIDGAMQQWALETKANLTTTVVESNLIPYLRNPVSCPVGKTFADSYTLVDVGTTPVCQKAPLTHHLP